MKFLNAPKAKHSTRGLRISPLCADFQCNCELCGDERQLYLIRPSSRVCKLFITRELQIGKQQLLYTFTKYALSINDHKRLLRRETIKIVVYCTQMKEGRLDLFSKAKERETFFTPPFFSVMVRRKSTFKTPNDFGLSL